MGLNRSVKNMIKLEFKFKCARHYLNAIFKNSQITLTKCCYYIAPTSQHSPTATLILLRSAIVTLNTLPSANVTPIF
jgi:hypothetical protein